MKTIYIDSDRELGKIKPMHAVNNGPILGPGSGRFEYLKEAGIPYARLHDAGGAYGANVYVDIANVFRDFDADASDPNSYDFAFTDWLLARLVENGATPFYRLGTSIENGHGIKAYRIFPPKDNLQWAKICEGIIRHYTQGWANGFTYDIKYWEIWNEPDNEPVATDNPMWRGTKEQFFALYQTAASYLKEKFPHLKIGGYGSCGFYKIAEIASNPNANVSSRIDYFVEFFHEFLQYIRDEKHKAPLDFFSWHSYADVNANVIFSNYARKTLDEYGFFETEHICNEWNPGIGLRGKLRDATNIAVNMIALHHTTLDMAMYYDWRMNTGYCGVLNPLGWQPFPAFYAFKAFNELYRLGTEIYTRIEADKIYCLGAKNGAENALLLANYTNEAQDITFAFAGKSECFDGWIYIVDEKRVYEETPFCLQADSPLKLEKDAVVLIKWKTK